ncbi:uncharacterized protein JCM10292_002041 [Rhodotorula paludigena]|uniref:uncharacterized protein n=1 Tax=Rhodotorula paludigena TaxID=86838 RepID=UPI00316E1643
MPDIFVDALSFSTTPRSAGSGHEAAAPPAIASSSAALLDKAPRPKQRNCAACRMRRVKCERLDGQQDCVGCVQRGLRCVPYEAKPRGQFRDGKRVKAVKELYGDLENLESTTSTPASTTAASPSAAIEGVVELRPTVSYSSGNVRLGAIELKEAVLSNLLESFFAYQSAAVFHRDIDFRQTFDFAGRRIDQLSSPNQVLCSVLLALGARCSDHPALIGSSAPRMGDLGRLTRQDADLREYGRAREAACEALVAQALTLADEKGTFRVASVENVAALMLLESLQRSEAVWTATPTYSRHYNSHVRELLNEAQNDNVLRKSVEGSVMSWTAFFRDAFTSAATGISPLFSDDEFWLLRGEQDPPPPLPEQLLRPLTHDPERDWIALMDSYLHWTVDLSRQVAAHLTSVRARKKPQMDLPFARDMHHKLLIALSALPELLRRSRLLNDVKNISVISRSLRMSTCNLVHLLHRVVLERLAERPSGIISDVEQWSSAPDRDYWAALEQLEKEVAWCAFGASREIIAALKDLLDAGIPLGNHEWLDARGMLILFSRLPHWSPIIVRQATAEEGGPPNFTFADKLQDLQTLARALRSVGWASSELARPLDWINTEIASLEARRGMMLRSLSRPIGGAGLLAYPPASITTLSLESVFLPRDPVSAAPHALEGPHSTDNVVFDPPLAFPHADLDALLRSLAEPQPSNESSPSFETSQPAPLAELSDTGRFDQSGLPQPSQPFLTSSQDGTQPNDPLADLPF